MDGEMRLMSNKHAGREELELHITRLKDAYRRGDVPDEIITPALEGLALDEDGRRAYFTALVDLVEDAVAEDFVRGRRTCGTGKLNLGKPLREVAEHQAIAFLGSVVGFHDDEKVREVWYQTEPKLKEHMRYF